MSQNIQTAYERRKACASALRRKGKRKEFYLLSTLFMSVVVAVGSSMWKQQKELQKEKIQAQKDVVTDAVLIEKKGNVVSTGYAGLMFFGKNGQTNHSDAVMHYVTDDPAKIEEIRMLQPGTVRKVSEWKKFFPTGPRKVYSWYELNREKGK